MGRGGGVPPRARWLIWLAYVAAWTAALCSPVPPTEPWEVGDLDVDLKYLFGKKLHLLAYAGMAILAGWLRAPARWRWLLVFFVMAHATITETVQTFVPSRGGMLADVALDHVGIALGLLVSWKWWSAPD